MVYSTVECVYHYLRCLRYILRPWCFIVMTTTKLRAFKGIDTTKLRVFIGISSKEVKTFTVMRTTKTEGIYSNKNHKTEAIYIYNYQKRRPFILRCHRSSQQPMQQLVALLQETQD